MDASQPPPPPSSSGPPLPHRGAPPRPAPATWRPGLSPLPPLYPSTAPVLPEGVTPPPGLSPPASRTGRDPSDSLGGSAPSTASQAVQEEISSSSARDAQNGSDSERSRPRSRSLQRRAGQLTPPSSRPSSGRASWEPRPPQSDHRDGTSTPLDHLSQRVRDSLPRDSPSRTPSPPPGPHSQPRPASMQRTRTHPRTSPSSLLKERPPQPEPPERPSQKDIGTQRRSASLLGDPKSEVPPRPSPGGRGPWAPLREGRTSQETPSPPRDPRDSRYITPGPRRPPTNSSLLLQPLEPALPSGDDSATSSLLQDKQDTTPRQWGSPWASLFSSPSWQCTDFSFLFSPRPPSIFQIVIAPHVRLVPHGATPPAPRGGNMPSPRRIL